MKRTIVAVTAVAIALGIGGFAQTRQDKGGGDVTGPYELAAGWPQNWCGQGSTRCS